MTDSTFSRQLLPIPTPDGWLEKLGALASADLTTGVVVPTLTLVTNLDAATAGSLWYIQFQNLVVLWGSVAVDAIAAASAATELGIALPVASGFTGSGQAAGVASAEAINSVAAISADATNDRLALKWASQSTASITMRFVAGYVVV